MGTAMRWLGDQGWLCHRMGHIHGVRGRKFIDWDLLAPEIEGTIHFVFKDASKAAMFKLACGGQC
jgi:hypothetical protein